MCHKLQDPQKRHRLSKNAFIITLCVRPVVRMSVRGQLSKEKKKSSQLNRFVYFYILWHTDRCHQGLTVDARETYKRSSRSVTGKKDNSCFVIFSSYLS